MEKTFRQKKEGTRGNPRAGAHRPQHKMNEMYEQCFPMELNKTIGKTLRQLHERRQAIKKLFSANEKEQHTVQKEVH